MTNGLIVTVAISASDFDEAVHAIDVAPGLHVFSDINPAAKTALTIAKSTDDVAEGDQLKFRDEVADALGRSGITAVVVGGGLY